MNNALEKRNTFLHGKYHQSNSVCILKDFSLKLDEQMRQIRLMNRKEKKNSSLHNRLILPNINEKSKKRLNHSIDNKLNQIEMKIINMEKGCEVFNNNSKLKNAFEQVNDSNQNSYRSTLSTLKQNRYPPFHPVIQPLIIYPTTIITNPMQNFPSNCNSENNNPYKNPNFFQGTNPFNESRTSLSSNNFSKPRRTFLKRRFRIISLSVFFIFLFKKYSKSITYMKYLKFEEVEDIYEQKQKIQSEILKNMLKFNMYDNFFQICKEVELKTKNQGYSVGIPYEDEQIVVNVKASQRFISAFLDHVHEVLKKNQFKELTLINVQFLNGSFPLSNMLLRQQLKLINFNESGCLKVTPEMSKMLIINYFFIKIILYQLLCKKHLMKILKKAFHKKYTEKKFILLYGKKLVVSLVLFYQALNSIFFNNMKKKSTTYDALSSNLKPLAMKQIQYNFNISYEDMIGDEKHLVKKINSSSELVATFMEIFQEIWDKVKKITQLLYKKAGKHQTDQIFQIKEKFKNQPFPRKEQLQSFLKKKVNRKNKKTQDSEIQISDQSKTVKSFKSGTSKSIANKKQQKNKK